MKKNEWKLHKRRRQEEKEIKNEIMKKTLWKIIEHSG